MIYCDYGCNQEGLYQLKNGKYCCSKWSVQCPEVKLKNSIGISKAHKENPNMHAHIKPGKMNGWTSGGRNNTGNKYETSIDEIFIENSLYGNEYIKERIFHDNLIPSNKCIICGIENWNNKSIILELDHINGVHTDNRLGNLRFLCPNCHSQTDTFRGRNTNTGKIKVTDEELLAALKETTSIRQALYKVKLSPRGCNYKRVYKVMINNTSIQQKVIDKNPIIKNEPINKIIPEKVCKQCNKVFTPSHNSNKCCSKTCSDLSQRKVDRPTKEELYKLVWSISTVNIAKYYNVSDNTISKWCKSYGIDKPPVGYWAKVYSGKI